MQKSFLRETADVIVKSVVIVFTFIIVISAVSVLYQGESDVGDGSCNIAVFPVEGAILPFYGIGDFDLITTPESVETFMSAVELELGIEGVLIEINSPGGTPVASERIAQRFRSSELPVVGLIGDVAASGGYMVAAATDYLIASPMSVVGSIGVTMSYLEESEKNEEEGITYVQLTTGKYKDIGSPNRPITDEERELLQADLQVVHDEFVDIVANYRDLEREQVVEMADGSTMPGLRALDNNLIDELGARYEAREKFAQILEIDASEVKFCEFERSFLPF